MSTADQDTVRKQYELAIEMADRREQRRLTANSDFVKLNLVALGAIATLAAAGVKLGAPIAAGPWLALMIAVLVGLMAQCVLWWATITSYHRLAAAKWEVVRILETRMPTMANAAGWTHLEADGHRHPYVPTIRIQQVMPVVFGLLYIASLIFVLLAF